MVSEGKEPDDESRRHFQEIINAYNSAVVASLQTLGQTRIDQLGEMSPNDFMARFCKSPLGVLGIDILSLEIRKEQRLIFYGLEERKLEFLPISKLAELKAKDARIAVISELSDGIFNSVCETVIYVNDVGLPKVDDVVISEVRLTKNAPREAEDPKVFIPQATSSAGFLKGVSITAIGSLLAEIIKKLLGL